MAGVEIMRHLGLAFHLGHFNDNFNYHSVKKGREPNCLMASPAMQV